VLARAFASLDEHFLHRDRAPEAAKPAEHEQPAPSATDFQKLMKEFEQNEAERREAARRAAAEHERERAEQLAEQHVSDEDWQTLLQRAQDAAQNGLNEFLLLQFPSRLCSDGGRAINVAEPDWPTTLRGEAAEIYLRWERDIKPHGFELGARVLNYPDGMPGDIGLFLTWSPASPT
jgi:hypothetical protein